MAKSQRAVNLEVRAKYWEGAKVGPLTHTTVKRQCFICGGWGNYLHEVDKGGHKATLGRSCLAKAKLHGPKAHTDPSQPPSGSKK